MASGNTIIIGRLHQFHHVQNTLCRLKDVRAVNEQQWLLDSCSVEISV